MFEATIDALLQLIGRPGGFSPPKPLEPIRFDPHERRAPDAPDTEALALRLHSLREEVPVDEFRRQVRNPLASRVLAVWVEVDLPQLRKRLVFDTRVDNPQAISPSLRTLTPDKAAHTWPKPQQRHNMTDVVPFGHGGSSCPGIFSRFAKESIGNSIEIPVEVLAFHAEGHNGEVAYGISMFSEVTGRVSAPSETGDGTLTMWGKMLISIRPDHPSHFGGHRYIELVSRDFIRQHGTVTGFPPKNAGEFIESSGNDVYVGHLPGQRHLRAVVAKGRIIFSTDVDDFLQARTRISGFTLVDGNGVAIDPGPPPYSPDLIGRIAGVRLVWEDVRQMDNRVTHYRLYRMDPDDITHIDLIEDRLTTNQFTDSTYDGTRSFAYAVVPAFIDQSGAEVQGVSLDHSQVLAIQPRAEQFIRRNFGVGHVKRIT